MIIHNLLQCILLLATVHCANCTDTSTVSSTISLYSKHCQLIHPSTTPPTIFSLPPSPPSPTPPPLHPRAQTTPPPPDPGNIPTSLHYTTLSAILTHSATPWTTVTYENIYFNTILVHDGLDTNLPYPSSITPGSPGSKATGSPETAGSGKGVGNLVFETGEAALLHEGTAWTTVTYVDVLSGSQEVSQFEIGVSSATASLAAAAAASSGSAASVSSGSVVSAVSAAASSIIISSSSSSSPDPGALGSGSILVAPGLTAAAPNLAPCRTATDFEGCVGGAESVALGTGGQAVGSSTSGLSSQGIVTAGVNGNAKGQGQGQGEATPTTTVTMPYLGAVVAKGKATFFEGGLESGGIRGKGKGRVEWGSWLWVVCVVIEGYLGGLVL
ncbi:hypothetical protein N7G274_003056 [Stereocaulon virgatum]|uniref:Dirigent protein n=1 Tax=Stereocaulon virgatum TaxID=373712 RepID=A0ABR4AFQ7_9LECA